MPRFSLYAYQEMEPGEVHAFDLAFADDSDHWVRFVIVFAWIQPILQFVIRLFSRISDLGKGSISTGTGF
jgi:hypothetical protein